MGKRIQQLLWLMALLLVLVVLRQGSERAIAYDRCRLPTRPPVRAGEGAKAVPVLLYHHLAPEGVGQHRTNPMVVPAEAFASQMEWLAAEGYYTPTLEELEGFVTGQIELPARSVLITFDDGYESNYHYAHPVLCRLGLRAVLYKVGRRTPNTEPFDPTKPTHLTWTQAQVMQESGIWAIENHSFAGHDKVNGKAPLLVWSPSEIARDMQAVADLWQAHNLRAPISIAYPFGEYNETVLDAVRRVGLRIGFTTKPGLVQPGMDLLQLPRQPVYPYHSPEAFRALVAGGSQ